MSELWRLPQGKGAWISSRGQRSMAKDPAKSTRLFLLEPQDAETLPRQAEAGQSKVRVPGPVFGASSSGRSLAVLAKRKATKTWSDPPVGIGLCSRSCPCPRQPGFAPDFRFSARPSPSFCAPGPRVCPLARRWHSGPTLPVDVLSLA